MELGPKRYLLEPFTPSLKVFEPRNGQEGPFCVRNEPWHHAYGRTKFNLSLNETDVLVLYSALEHAEAFAESLHPTHINNRSLEHRIWMHLTSSPITSNAKKWHHLLRSVSFPDAT